MEPKRTLLVSAVKAMLAALVLATGASGEAQAKSRAGRRHGDFDPVTRHYGGIILKVGLNMHVSFRQAVAALAAAMTETNGPDQSYPARITNPGYGDSSSVGLFQMLDIHGPYEKRVDPVWASRWFFSQARHESADSPAELAQDVEVSAYPDRYQSQVRDAGLLARELGYRRDPRGKLQRFRRPLRVARG